MAHHRTRSWLESKLILALQLKQPYSVVLSKSAAFSEKVTYNFYSCNIFLFLVIFYHIIWGMKNRRLESALRNQMLDVQLTLLLPGRRQSRI